MRGRKIVGWAVVFLSLQVLLIGASDHLPFQVRRLAVALPAPDGSLDTLSGVPLADAPGAPLPGADPPTQAGESSTAGTAGEDRTAPAALPRAAPPEPTPVPAPYGAPVRLVFAGDVHFAGALAGGLADNPVGLLAPLADLVAGADIAMVNLETAIITEDHAPQPKAFTFAAPPAALSALALAGVDVLAAANNHSVDYGPGGLAETLAAEKFTGVPLVGIGANEDEAYQPWVTDVRNRRIGAIAATQVLDDELIWSWKAGPAKAGVASAKHQQRLIKAVEAARRQVDTLVVYLHWGTEGESCPSADQRVLAEQLVAAGADIIVGTHAHTPQGGGRMGQAVVAYGLGNSVFYTGNQSGVFEVVAEGRQILEYRWVPAVLQGGVPYRLFGADADAAQAQWQALRGCTDLQS